MTDMALLLYIYSLSLSFFPFWLMNFFCEKNILQTFIFKALRKTNSALPKRFQKQQVFLYSHFMISVDYNLNKDHTTTDLRVKRLKSEWSLIFLLGLTYRWNYEWNYRFLVNVDTLYAILAAKVQFSSTASVRRVSEYYMMNNGFHSLTSAEIKCLIIYPDSQSWLSPLKKNQC